MPRLATDVKVFRYTDQGAPVLKGGAGFLQDLLYACLVTGYGTTTVSSMTRSGSEVTVTISSGHSFKQYAVIEISGANEDYNGLHRIESVTSTTFTFTLPEGKTPATPATGTISAKMASAGWTRSHVSGDGRRAVYKSSDPQAFGYYLYVDDTNTWTRRAGAKGYEIVTGIDARSNPFPYSATDDQWTYWYKSDDDNTARQWALVADSRMCYLWTNYNNTFNSGERIYAFGDLIPLGGANDPFCSIVQGHSSSSDTSYCGGMLTVTKPSTPNVSGCFFARDAYGFILGQKGIALAIGHACAATAYSSDMFPGHPYMISPYLATYYPQIGGILTSPVWLMEDRTGMLLRGQLPGLYVPLCNLSAYGNLTVFDAATRALMCVWSFASKGVYYTWDTGPRGGYVVFDIIGPWR